NLYLMLAVALFLLSTISVVNDTIYFVHSSVIRFNVVKNEDYALYINYQTWRDVERRVAKRV
ncbi:hypothetical protein VNI00_015887, partial [Paramarasmius palmivorus]